MTRKPAKTQRAEQQLTEKQRATLWKLYDSGDYEPENLADRYGMSLSEFDWFVQAMRSERRKKDRASVDWAAMWQAARAAG